MYHLMWKQSIATHRIRTLIGSVTVPRRELPLYNNARTLSSSFASSDHANATSTTRSPSSSSTALQFPGVGATRWSSSTLINFSLRQQCLAESMLIRRNFASKRKKSKSKSKSKPKLTTSTEKARPTPVVHKTKASGSSKQSTESKFQMPDRDKEIELSRIQNEITDHYRAGDYRRALNVSQELLTETESHFGKKHPATASAHNNAGLMHKLLGNFDEARQQYRSALRIYKEVLGPDHASYASLLHNLGNLNRSQIHFDTSLRATDRLSLVEEAEEHLRRAWQIRKAEMGTDHPHTVASRSAWGSTLATQILHYYKASSDASTGARPRYVSLKGAEVTEQGWAAAEEHLRQALQTAVDNPRGPSLPKTFKKNKKKSTDTDTPATSGINLQTLSAASSAQNLAVFLKARATTQTPYQVEWMNEAHGLYQNVLEVRTELLTAGHPDLYATKHSLAELLQAMGKEEEANTVRQEIVDTYDPPTEDVDAAKPSDDETPETLEPKQVES